MIFVFQFSALAWILFSTGDCRVWEYSREYPHAMNSNGSTVPPAALERRKLLPPQLLRLPFGVTLAQGWLMRELTLQAKGITGQLPYFWHFVNNSGWMGGSGSGGAAGEQYVPYYLNGLIPLSFQVRWCHKSLLFCLSSGVWQDPINSGSQTIFVQPVLVQHWTLPLWFLFKGTDCYVWKLFAYVSRSMMTTLYIYEKGTWRTF